MAFDPHYSSKKLFSDKSAVLINPLLLYSCFKLFNSIFFSVPRVQFRLTGVFETSLYIQEDSYIKTTKSYQKPVLRAWLTFIEVPILSDRSTVIICDSNTLNGTKPRILTP